MERGPYYAGNAKRLLADGTPPPPGPPARFQPLDACGRLGAMQHTARQNDWWLGAATAASFAGIAAGVYYVELADFQRRHPGATVPFGEGFVRVCLAGLAALSIFALVMHYNGRIYLLQIKGAWVSSSARVTFVSRLSRAGLLGAFVGDVLVHLVFPWPLLGIGNIHVSVLNDAPDAYSRYSLGDLLALAMFLRLRLLPRFCALWHPLNATDARFLGKLNSLEIEAGVIVRKLLSESLPFLLGLWGLAVLVLSYVIYICDRDAEDRLPEHATSHFAPCVWLALSTMTTVGFGDAHPVTRLGRMAAASGCLVAVVLFGLTINFAINALSLESNEETFLRVLRRVDACRAVKQAAVRVIEGTYRRSPMYDRLRLLKQRARSQGYQHGYQEIAPGVSSPDPEEHHSSIAQGCKIEMEAAPPEIRYGSARLTGSQLQNLRVALDDAALMGAVYAFRKARQNLARLTQICDMDATRQACELRDTQACLQRDIKTLGAHARHFDVITKRLDGRPTQKS